jgi:hypothetical protein
LRDRFRALVTTALSLSLTLTLLGAAPPTAAATLKVVIIVGPTGAQTDSYRSTGNSIAQTAEAAGAEVVKVYSPNATWPKVRAAVAGANVIVYLGHGNGYPNPYGSTELTDRANGWGLNTSTNNGDKDSWSAGTLVYCGEKALLGTLTSSDGSSQWNYCGGKNNTDGIDPAPGFVMIYNKACYAPGASESWDTKATESQAFQRVRNFSYPVLKQGAGAYFATDAYRGGESLVDLVLRNRNLPFGEIAKAANGYQASAQRHFDHPDLANREVWIQRTDGHGGMDYWYAFAGNPNLTPEGEVALAPHRTKKSPAAGSTVSVDARVRAWFDMPVQGLSRSSFSLVSDAGQLVDGTIRWNAVKLRATLIPNSPLDPSTRYTATLTSAIESLEGVPFAGFSWRFWTEEPGPQRTKKSPAAGSKVATDAKVRAWFDMPVQGLDETSFTLVSDSGQLVDAVVRWSPTPLRATLIPTAPLEPGMRYTATLSSAIESMTGVAFEGYSWRFWTDGDIEQP